ncbi:MAG: hypothetical protein IPH40_09345 [Polaromonas sp.]|nr:hypothetical protein [Polaromonas sp.]
MNTASLCQHPRRRGTMNIGGNLSMSAGNDFVAQDTQINAAGGVDISAGNDATITIANKAASPMAVVIKPTCWQPSTPEKSAKAVVAATSIGR